MFRRRLLLIVWIPLILLANACAGSIPAPDVPLNEAEAQLLSLSVDKPERMRIRSKIDYVDGINNKRVVGQDLVLSALADGRMRITISAFDKALAALVTDGSAFSLMDVSQNVFITGRATPENIAQILPVRLSAADLHRVIYGGFPQDDLFEDFEKNKEFQWDASKGGYKFSFKRRDGHTLHVYRNWPDGDVFFMRIENAAGDVLYAYEASDFQTYTSNGKTYRYAKQIIFRLPQQDTDVRLRVESRELDVEFSERVFMLQPPAGTRIIVMD